MLGVSKLAGQDEIKRAYRKLALKWRASHLQLLRWLTGRVAADPDKNPNDQRRAEVVTSCSSSHADVDMQEKFKLIAEAYATLSDPEVRKRYDSRQEEMPRARGYSTGRSTGQQQWADHSVRGNGGIKSSFTMAEAEQV